MFVKFENVRSNESVCFVVASEALRIKVAVNSRENPSLIYSILSNSIDSKTTTWKKLFWMLDSGNIDGATRSFLCLHRNIVCWFKVDLGLIIFQFYFLSCCVMLYSNNQNRNSSFPSSITIFWYFRQILHPKINKLKKKTNTDYHGIIELTKLDLPQQQLPQIILHFS